ncbi:cytochrome b5 isoform X4 [Apis mellifera]|nr:cytochrome b5 isoform X4 [Apis mellifera]XP_016770205.2 cytochrome b5 isoform X4 [Apis mellifera]XP_026299418.1 cytochrome b5 isoform X4 [Apis mellifera]XP_026299419.1 cytochrome b5 isoform X4 [Apis mellifera]XP_026299420.1 cytochrome b5 isoform X4 [Apis mellifera]XP_026299421.1 cytochrome b5 isoform X4 [Apis mellifera]XP_026299422.1 cytochrome b5 isoform X4 [Apis mellifera]|eukprot:XP_016770204.2 cytochrome b5 isoform X4 [Apis mellifera]
MDLLSVSFRSMADLEPEQEEFLELEGRSIVEKVEPSEKSRLISGDEESVDNGEKNSLKDLRTINLNEVAWHDTVDSCWIVIRDFVYDCTDFLKSHPGGSDVILEYAGRDATLAFIGTGHSSAAIHSLKRYLIGELPVEERIFRVPNGLKISAS